MQSILIFNVIEFVVFYYVYMCLIKCLQRQFIVMRVENNLNVIFIDDYDISII